MKRLFALALALAFLSLSPLCARVGPAWTEASLRRKYPEYFGVGAYKGLDVYVWAEDGGACRCGLLPGTNRGATREELEALRENGATIAEMRAILSSYDIRGETPFISVLPFGDGPDDEAMAWIARALLAG